MIQSAHTKAPSDRPEASKVFMAAMSRWRLPGRTKWRHHEHRERQQRRIGGVPLHRPWGGIHPCQHDTIWQYHAICATNDIPIQYMWVDLLYMSRMWTLMIYGIIRVSYIGLVHNKKHLFLDSISLWHKQNYLHPVHFPGRSLPPSMKPANKHQSSTIGNRPTINNHWNCDQYDNRQY